MMKLAARWLAVASLILTTSACALNEFAHNSFMRGSIVRVSDEQLVVCLGSESGIKPGMRFSAYKIYYTGSIEEGTDEYSRSRIGEIEILSVIDKHFARARAVQGKLEVGDVVEFAATNRQ